jgi:hypothetical protein
MLSSFCVGVPRILVSMAESASRTQTISSASANTPDIQVPVFSRIFFFKREADFESRRFLPRCGVSHVAQLVLLRPVSESSS